MKSLQFAFPTASRHLDAVFLRNSYVQAKGPKLRFHWAACSACISIDCHFAFVFSNRSMSSPGYALFEIEAWVLNVTTRRGRLSRAAGVHMYDAIIVCLKSRVRQSHGMSSFLPEIDGISTNCSTSRA